MDFDYDLFVIGAGSGGVRAARMSAGYGAKVGVAEEYRVGGTCVIRGCVPKKLFVYSSRFSGDVEDAAGFGWQFGQGDFDWNALLKAKDREIDRLNGIYLRNLELAGVDVFQSRAVLVDRHRVRLEKDGRVISAKHFLIATGAHPFVPDIPGHQHAITSNEAFHLEQLPESIVIVGGGYIALEFACIFNGLGVDVVVFYRGDQILRGFDGDMRDGLSDEMTKEGIDVRVKTNPVRIEKEGSSYRVFLEDGDEVTTGLVMYATGRHPLSAGLGLEDCGVKLGAKGEIPVDDYSQTEVDNIYAVGDVTGRQALTPVAIHEGAAFAETVFNDRPTPVDHWLIPTAVFTTPEIGTVGMSEEEARAAGHSIDIYKSEFRPMKHTLSGRDTRMIMKLIVDQSSDLVLGCHILGDDAAEIVQMLAIAMRMGAKKADLDGTMALHPSAAEELVTMRNKWVPAS